MTLYRPTAVEFQRRLIEMGYDLGKGGADGVIGPATLAAAWDALPRPASPPAPHPAPPASASAGILPAIWLPDAPMQRIIFHWTAGGYEASSLDREHYHFLIEGDGNAVRGEFPVTANVAPKPGAYAAHTLNCNTRSIGISLCCMAGAQESPFNAGTAPMTAEQWANGVKAGAQLCRRYSIPPTPKTVLTHAEVQANLGIQQRGKWDIAALPFDPNFPRTAKAVGDRLRAEIAALI